MKQSKEEQYTKLLTHYRQTIRRAVMDLTPDANDPDVYVDYVAVRERLRRALKGIG